MALAMVGQGSTAEMTPQGQGQQQTIPDAPKPQAVPLSGVAPGKGTTATSNGEVGRTAPVDPDAPATRLPDSPQQNAADKDAGPPPDQPAAGDYAAYVLGPLQVNFVDIPFTVKDNKGRLVPGLSWRDIRIYENGLRQRMQVFTVDPLPMSVAVVVDQSMPFDTMNRVNASLGALQGAFAPYDEVTLFTYNNGPKQQMGYTAGQSALFPAMLERSKSGGREAMYYAPGEALGGGININNGAQANLTPLTSNAPGGTHGIDQVPREVHTLNDAILAAAISLRDKPVNRRRIIYVISDGKEYGSTAKTKDVIHYLQTNKIAVYATLTGDASVSGLGFLDKYHLPFQMRDNNLPAYTNATGGQTFAEYRTKGIEESFQKVTEQVRTQYTVGYYSREPFIDGKYRKIEVQVMRPNLSVIAKDGYYPTPEKQQPPAPTVMSGKPPAVVKP